MSSPICSSSTQYSSRSDRLPRVSACDIFHAPSSEPNQFLLDNIELCRCSTPTPVQEYSIPIVSAFRDLMACAQTGSGKTGAILFPILSASFTVGPSAHRKPKEVMDAAKHSRLPGSCKLVSQIYDEACRSWVLTAVVYGGADISLQLKQIERGCDLLVATPGRLVDLIERGRMSRQRQVSCLRRSRSQA